jgi:hypothetical protein
MSRSILGTLPAAGKSGRRWPRDQSRSRLHEERVRPNGSKPDDLPRPQAGTDRQLGLGARVGGKLIASGVALTAAEARAAAMLEGMTRLERRSGDGVGKVGP